MKNKKNTIFIALYNGYPMTSGASTVTTSLFLGWPTTKKKLFQISHENRSYNQNVLNFNVLSNNKLVKLISLPFFIFNILRHNIKKNVDYFIFEGASWVGYIYFLHLILKIFFKKSKFIYHSHNVETDLRKNNHLIFLLTFYFEKKVLNNFDFVTAVSKTDQKIFRKRYKVNTIILENGIFLNNLNLKKSKEKLKYIIFPGSLEFKENKKIFTKLYTEIFPFLKKIDKNFKIMITGSDIKFFKNNNDIIEVGVLSKKSFLKFLKSSWALILPANKGPGTKIKIIEALCYNKVVFASKNALNGIEKQLTKDISYSNKEELFKKIKYFNNNQAKTLKKFNLIGKKFRKKFDMKIIAKNFYEIIK